MSKLLSGVLQFISHIALCTLFSGYLVSACAQPAHEAGFRRVSTHLADHGSLSDFLQLQRRSDLSQWRCLDLAYPYITNQLRKELLGNTNKRVTDVNGRVPSGRRVNDKPSFIKTVRINPLYSFADISR
ncbi:hypothetical protein Xmau_02996 [Xenorhabdus mauleonii]|uniref:Uncharacterized protein n=1 Tax=Xenorhabdus mauleonii TaxID=351675 RepID=A0A1I3S884_9GAMM|nr:hypothetical protein [Xenorhabdus mauleonii]PHM39092.1 hypothetical protein Xmau_02996 [Xenorhabdus mauleonii]SFJ55024.1 hypothetical protein SAMN05421680_11117 [Xenorhabdus mauleonii]